jgi:tRNA modification GTPase
LVPAGMLTELSKSFGETIKQARITKVGTRWQYQPVVPVMISCHEAESSGGERGHIDLVVKDLAAKFQSMTELPHALRELVGVTERSRQLLEKTLQSLKSYLREAKRENKEPDIVVAAEHLREAAQSLARITGRNTAGDVEEVLGVVFEK